MLQPQHIQVLSQLIIEQPSSSADTAWRREVDIIAAIPWPRYTLHRAIQDLATDRLIDIRYHGMCEIRIADWDRVVMEIAQS
jgi:hypothetical protein